MKSIRCKEQSLITLPTTQIQFTRTATKQHRNRKVVQFDHAQYCNDIFPVLAGRQMEIDLKKDNGTTVTADASVDDVVVDFKNFNMALFSTYEAFVIIKSPAFQFVDQTISIEGK